MLEAGMSEWKAKRFWQDVTVEPVEDGFRILLDARALNTPGKMPLVLPTRALADAVAAEWAAQEDVIKPLEMPATRSANSAVERVATQHTEVADMLAAYGETDLLFYRAEGPEELTQRQEAAWDPLLDWAAETYGARLKVGAGILPLSQDPNAVAKLRAVVHGVAPFPMTALHDLITLTGSLILGLAVFSGRIKASEAWTTSRIDEDWQIAQWGEDAEATEAAEARAAQLNHAEWFLRLTFAN